jgi:DNA polymerase
MIVGEQPGDEEEKQGHPFVGPAGRLLQEALDAADVVLQHEVLIDIARHLGFGKRFSAEPTLFTDDTAKTLLDDIIAANPDQRTELMAIRERMPWGKRRSA